MNSQAGSSSIDRRLGGRNLYIVQMVPYAPGLESEYLKLYEIYWQAVERQLTTVEERVGVVRHIFTEGIANQGEDAKVTLERANPGAWRVVKERLDSGAKIDAYEDQETLFEVLDWSRCASLGITSTRVAELIRSRYSDADKRRREFHRTALEQGIVAGESALLLSSGDSPSVPEGVERVIIAPPEMDALERWSRDYAQRIQDPQHQAQSHAAPKADSNSGSGLWIPGDP